MSKIPVIQTYAWRRGKHKFTANGKLMITGEYLVMAGAYALAMPVAYGQQLIIERKRHSHPAVQWSTFVKGTQWLDAEFVGPELNINYKHEVGEEDKKHYENLRNILLAARKLEPAFMSDNVLWKARSEINHDLNWGLGSSSALIVNIASWIGVDPFKLHFSLSAGSGYDIACAKAQTGILYKFNGRNNPPMIITKPFNPVFASKMYFVYSGKKQSTEESLKNFDVSKVKEMDVHHLNELTKKMAKTTSMSRFMHMMMKHEQIISKYAGISSVKKTLFPDFFGAIKSLGAWGGDFMLVVSDMSLESIKKYFNSRGYDTIFPFMEMRIKRKYQPYAKQTTNKD